MTAVANSIIVMAKLPSPTHATTWRSGKVSFAAMAAGKGKPHRSPFSREENVLLCGPENAVKPNRVVTSVNCDDGAIVHCFIEGGYDALWCNGVGVVLALPVQGRVEVCSRFVNVSLPRGLRSLRQLLSDEGENLGGIADKAADHFRMGLNTGRRSVNVNHLGVFWDEPLRPPVGTDGEHAVRLLQQISARFTSTFSNAAYI